MNYFAALIESHFTALSLSILGTYVDIYLFLFLGTTGNRQKFHFLDSFFLLNSLFEDHYFVGEDTEDFLMKTNRVKLNESNGLELKP